MVFVWATALRPRNDTSHALDISRNINAHVLILDGMIVLLPAEGANNALLKQSADLDMNKCMLVVVTCASSFGCMTVEQREAELHPPVRQGTVRKTTQIPMTIQDYSFSPASLIASPGQTLALMITNKGKEEHGLVFDFPSGAVASPFHFRPNESRQFNVIVPNQPGTYHFHCPVGNHYARAMEGDLVVR